MIFVEIEAHEHIHAILPSLKAFPMKIESYKSLKPLTWMKVGGPADYYTEVVTKEELRSAFSFAKEQDLPVIYLGQGSNMIVSDKGFRGLVIRLMNDEISWEAERAERGESDPSTGSESAEVHVQGGLILAKLLREARKRKLSGLDNFVGIPGTVGAAIRGNIGIPKEEFGEIVEEVECFDGKSFFTLKPEDCDFRYRGSKLKDEYWLVWSAVLKLRRGKPALTDEWLLERLAKQPKGHSCGSFFKNPDPKNGIYAGQLIETVGLKGKKRGGAFVSEVHGNFIMNDGTGTATEILDLAREVKQKVLEKRGILLENEVLLYNEKGKLIDL